MRLAISTTETLTGLKTDLVGANNNIINPVVKSFKFPDVDVVTALMSNESALTRMTDLTPKNFGQT